MVSSTNKTDCHIITEILLKVVLNIITLTPTLYVCYELGIPLWIFFLNFDKLHVEMTALCLMFIYGQ